MVVRFRNRRASRPAIVSITALIGALALALVAAWSSQDPGRFASFYAEDGSLIVNGKCLRGARRHSEHGRRVHGRLPRHAGADGLRHPGRRTGRLPLDVDRD